jgi:hypothetical protein
MELRQLTTDSERRTFAQRMAEARTTRGIGWSETSRSALGKAHITYGNVYALFENEGEPTERMVGGFILHDLASFPQTLPKPDLSHLPPQSILEGSDLWSLSKGVGLLAGIMAAAVAGVSQAKAILVYPMLRPTDLSAFYYHLNFVKACEPLSWPYAKTVDGSGIWVQPMILEGEELEEYVRSGFDFLFRTSDERQALRFGGLSTARLLKPAAAAVSRSEERPSVPSQISLTRESEDRNGAASH